ncbi:unnamed protein product [Arctogadus glacialis]
MKLLLSLPSRLVPCTLPDLARPDRNAIHQPGDQPIDRTIGVFITHPEASLTRLVEGKEDCSERGNRNRVVCGGICPHKQFVRNFWDKILRINL